MFTMIGMTIPAMARRNTGSEGPHIATHQYTTISTMAATTVVMIKNRVRKLIMLIHSVNGFPHRWNGMRSPKIGS